MKKIKAAPGAAGPGTIALVTPAFAAIVSPVVVRPNVIESTTWTAGTSGNFTTAGNWSNGVPTSGVDATIDENSNNSITVTLSAATAIADSVSTSYAGLLLSNATLTLQGASSASSIDTGTSTALTQTGGLLDFQNGPSENDTSSIVSAGAAVIQNSGTIEVDAGTLDITGNSTFNGTITGSGGKPDSGLVQLLGSATYSFGSSASLSVGAFSLDGSGAHLLINSGLKYQGGFTETGGNTLVLGSKVLLQLQDTATAHDVLGGFITGGNTQNEAVTVLNGATIDSNSTLTNGGTFLLNTGGGTALTLDTDGTTLPLLQNYSGDIVDALNGAYSILGGSFSNAGSIVLGTAADLTVTSLLTDTGAISVAAGDVFNIDNSFTASGKISGAGTFQINGGGTDTISSTSTISAGAFIMNVYNDNVTLTIDSAAITASQLAFEQGGLVNFATGLSYAGTFTASANAALLTLNLGANNVSIAGPAYFEPSNFGSIAITGTGTFSVAGATLIEYGGLTLANGTHFSNSGSLTQTANLLIGNSTGPAAITNAAKGVWNLLGATIGYTGSNIGSSFTNAGLLENTGAGATAVVDTAFTSSGTISASAGYETDFYGGLANSGTISGAGTIGLRGGSSNVFSAGSSITIAQINLYDSAALTLGASLAYAGVFNDLGSNSYAAVTNLGSFALSLGGNSFFGNAAIDGAGTATISGTGTIVSGTNGLDIGGGATLVNTGTLVENQQIEIGDSTGTLSGVTNTATGTWTLANGYGLNRGSNAGVTFLNQGLFQNTDQGSADAINPNLTNTGTISINAGTEIDVYSKLANSGSIAGAGTLGIRGSAAATFSAGETISVARINLYDNATLSLATGLTYAGAFIDEGSSGNTLALGGNTLSLTGAAQFGSGNNTALVTGAGLLLVSGSTTITNANNGLQLGAGARMQNKFTVVQNGQVVIGDSSGVSSSIANTSTGTWALSTGAGITTGTNSSSSFSNAGLFENVATGATQGIYTVFSNTGTVNIGTNDETDFYNSTTSTGKLTGAGSLGIRGSGTFTIGAASTVGVDHINLYDTATLDLGLNLGYGGIFSDQGSNGTTLNLQGHTLTLSGQSSFGSGNNAAYLYGPGTISITGTSTITNSNQGIELGTTAVLVNSGTVTQNGEVQIGDSSGDVTGITNSANGTWSVATGAGITTGTNGSSSFTNNGLFAVTVTGATQSIYAVFNNAASFSIATADTVDVYNTLNNTGTISGPGTLAIRGAGQATFSAGSTLTASQINLYDTATLTLGTSLVYAGAFNDEGSNGTTLNLGSNTLSLTGTAYFGSGNNQAYLTGTGTLALSAATIITDANQGLELGDTLTLANTGTVTQNGQVQIGDNSGDLATIINSAGAVWNIAAGRGISTGSNGSSSFTNTGLLNNTGTESYVTFGAVLDTTGTLNVQSASSTTALFNGGSIGGTLSGAGEIDFDNTGVYTIAAGTALDVATIGIYSTGTEVTLASAETFGGTFTLGEGASLALAGASTGFTLSGQDTLAGTVLGAGTLAIAAGATLVSDQLTLGGSVGLVDQGLIATDGNMFIGNSAVSSASLAIVAGAVFEITGNAGIESEGTGAISNAGTFEMLQGTGEATVNPIFTNSGSVFSESGVLAFGSAVTNNGTITAQNGNAVDFASAVSASGSASGQIDLTNGGLATFGGFVGSAETLAFTAGTTSIATLNDPSGFNGTITGFGSENEFHLLDFTSATGTYSGGVLTLNAETQQGTLTTAYLHFTGSYSNSSFDIIGDNSTGTVIQYV